MQGYHGAERREEAAYEPPPEPAGEKTHAREFQREDTATFNDRDGRNITGVIVRINPRTPTLGTGDAGTWRVPFHALLPCARRLSSVDLVSQLASRGP
ncbi:hypothetical protein [Variovorax sp. WS11]|uniref:hypothetical protein n=1 Tax=Variovorax sp. WS11 TaxID=1105204 RepID=UPI0013DA064D|nr:hypothetical protein [Variovorax sp. WS11]NDZ18942.1 hypothetical protein [Variovorax sp. WS11]